MTLTAPIPVQAPARHPPITIRCRIPHTENGLSYTDMWRHAQSRIEAAIMRTLQPSPWSILDGDIGWTATPAPGPALILTGTWRQR